MAGIKAIVGESHTTTGTPAPLASVVDLGCDLRHRGLIDERTTSSPSACRYPLSPWHPHHRLDERIGVITVHVEPVGTEHACPELRNFSAAAPFAA